MTQQINEITKVPSNATVIKILNQIIKRYNSLSNLYLYKGSVQTYDDLLAIQNPQIGDVYNVIQEDAEEGIAAGSNFAWNGTEWDNLGMGMDGLVKKINGFTPDDLGAVIFQYIKTIEDDDGTLTVTIRNGEEESTLTIDTGKVKTVNGVEPDETGNISINVQQLTKATQAEAETGTNNTKYMTPLRTKEAIAVQMQGIPVGDVVYRPFLMAGYVKANGATVSRSDYPTLVDFATKNNLWTETPASEPWKYGVGDGSSTMVLPNYHSRFIEGGNNVRTINAGLPNITDRISTYACNWNVASILIDSTTGIFKNDGSGSGAYTNAEARSYGTGTRYIKFDASQANSIYGNAETVQPAAIVLIPQIKY